MTTASFRGAVRCTAYCSIRAVFTSEMPLSVSDACVLRPLGAGLHRAVFLYWGSLTRPRRLGAG